MNEIRLVINKDGVAEMLPEPFATIEVQTEEDMKNIEDAVKKSVVAYISLDKKTKEFLCPNCNKVLSFEDNYCSKCDC